MWKKAFLDRCKEMNVDADKYFELHFTKSEKNDEYKSSTFGSHLVAEYFVLFLKHRNIWLAWQKRSNSKRSVFYVKKESIDNMFETNFGIVSKNVEFSGWGEENVYVFTNDEIETFIKFAVNRANKEKEGRAK